MHRFCDEVQSAFAAIRMNDQSSEMWSLAVMVVLVVLQRQIDACGEGSVEKESRFCWCCICWLNLNVQEVNPKQWEVLWLLMAPPQNLSHHERDLVLHLKLSKTQRHRHTERK